jgi:hypothetical protein
MIVGHVPGRSRTLMSYFDERIAHLQGIISSYVDVPCNGKVYIEDHSTLFYKSRDDTSAG